MKRYSISLITAAAAKSLQSCSTLCDPMDGSPTGSPIPGILQARTLEWDAISFSNAWKWKVKVSCSVVLTLSDSMDCSLSDSSLHGIFQARVLEWVAIAFSTLIFWEMQIKIIVKYHPTPIRMSIIRKTKDNKCWWECEEKGTLGVTLVGTQIGADTMENSIEAPQKIKTKTIQWSSNLTSGYISKGNKNKVSKRYLFSHVYYVYSK